MASPSFLIPPIGVFCSSVTENSTEVQTAASAVQTLKFIRMCVNARRVLTREELIEARRVKEEAAFFSLKKAGVIAATSIFFLSLSWPLHSRH